MACKKSKGVFYATTISQFESVWNYIRMLSEKGFWLTVESAVHADRGNAVTITIVLRYVDNGPQPLLHLNVLWVTTEE